jgi:hypothetical protein
MLTPSLRWPLREFGEIDEGEVSIGGLAALKAR